MGHEVKAVKSGAVKALDHADRYHIYLTRILPSSDAVCCAEHVVCESLLFVIACSVQASPELLFDSPIRWPACSAGL